MATEYTPEQLKEWRKRSFANLPALEDHLVVGCYYCEQTFAPSKITECCHEEGGSRTAVCPHCGIDSVVPSSDPDLLRALYNDSFVPKAKQ